MSNYFSKFPKIEYKGPDSEDPLSYKYYDPKRIVLGKTMEEHLRIGVCFWHNFCWEGADVFGDPTMNRPWLKKESPMETARERVKAAFEFFEKINVPYFCFHDRDVSPYGKTIQESNENLSTVASWIHEEMERTGKELLWGTAQLFAHPRFMSGAATNPDPEVFAYSVAQLKHALDITHQLKGHNYVLWGGREGYETLLNTDLSKEMDQYGRFLSMIAEYKHKIGFKGLLLIEPKPCEPTIHQYDFDCGHVYAFLQKYGLENEFKVNIEVNHAILAGHTFAHEVAYALSNGIFGSIDANEGDYLRGWDTDQFPMRLSEYTHVMYLLLQNGGFTSGGFNLDTKLRRQSIDLEDLFHAHILGIDTLARALLNASELIEKKALSNTLEKRYAGWEGPFGKKVIEAASLESVAALGESVDPKPKSGRQEYLEGILNTFTR